MDDNRFYYIPKRLNEPRRWVIFTLDEIIPAILMFVVLMLGGFMLTGVIMAAVVIYLIKRFKAGRSRDYFKRKLFAMGLLFFWVKNQATRKKSFIR